MKNKENCYFQGQFFMPHVNFLMRHEKAEALSQPGTADCFAAGSRMGLQLDAGGACVGFA
jgi:hypothetical protein